MTTRPDIDPRPGKNPTPKCDAVSGVMHRAVQIRMGVIDTFRTNPSALFSPSPVLALITSPTPVVSATLLCALSPSAETNQPISAQWGIKKAANHQSYQQ
jgi:hypothetical protein